jgi:PKD repeat protein
VAILFDLPVEGMDQATANSLIPNIELPSPVVWVFEKDMTEYEKTTNQSYKTTGGFLRKQDATVQELFPIAWSKLNIDVKKQFLSLPNFDADKFLKCTGVDVRLDVELYPKSKIELITTEEVQTVVIGGKTYKLVEVNS